MKYAESQVPSVAIQIVARWKRGQPLDREWRAEDVADVL